MSGSKLHDDINAKLYKLRGAGKDIVPALNPIFAAMDTGKTGALGASEFKTCLLALGIRTSVNDIEDLFGCFEGLHLRSGNRVAYVGFVKSLVEALPTIPGYVAPRPKAFVSRLVANEEVEAARAHAARNAQAQRRRAEAPAAYVFPGSAAMGPGGQKLSDEVFTQLICHGEGGSSRRAAVAASAKQPPHMLRIQNPAPPCVMRLPLFAPDDNNNNNHHHHAC
jgi:hypothetical protein